MNSGTIGKFEAAKVRVRVLGEIAVWCGPERVSLPSSRKARALLGYLALTARPHRRARLCELFWDLPDDPRAALRWALSKLRGALDGAGAEAIQADRERVAIDPDVVISDLSTHRARIAPDAPFVPPGLLRSAAEDLARPVLDGLEEAGDEAFAAWLAAEREDAALLRRNVLRRLATHPDLDPAERLRWAHRWIEAAPFDAAAMTCNVDLTRLNGMVDEAVSLEERYARTLRQAGLDATPLAHTDLHASEQAATARRRLRHQSIGFATAHDGVRIAYATVGGGPPLVKAANWLNHLELDWGSPIWGRTFGACAVGRTFVRYDERGNGLSDWDVADLSFDAFVRDLECVVDTLGLERFPLLGLSQGCAVSVEYAVRHPERVSALVLVSGYATGWRIGASPQECERREAVLTLTRHGWGTANPAYRHIFSQTFMPDATPQELEWFDEFQRQTTSPDNAVRFQEVFGTIDVRDALSRVRTPTIVFHSRGDRRVAMDQGRALAAGIPGARFVPLDSRNHILLGHEPAWIQCRDMTRRFLAENGA